MSTLLQNLENIESKVLLCNHHHCLSAAIKEQIKTLEVIYKTYSISDHSSCSIMHHKQGIHMTADNVDNHTNILRDSIRHCLLSIDSTAQAITVVSVIMKRRFHVLSQLVAESYVL